MSARPKLQFVSKVPVGSRPWPVAHVVDPRRTGVTFCGTEFSLTGGWTTRRDPRLDAVKMCGSCERMLGSAMEALRAAARVTR